MLVRIMCFCHLDARSVPEYTLKSCEVKSLLFKYLLLPVSKRYSSLVSFHTFLLLLLGVVQHLSNERAHSQEAEQEQEQWQLDGIFTRQEEALEQVVVVQEREQEHPGRVVGEDSNGHG